MNYKNLDIYNPTQEHAMLREMVRSFVHSEVEPQAQEFDRKEEFNLPLFKKLGKMGLLGITADPNFGGAGMDATSAVIAHEELSYSDPGFCLAYLAHSILCVNNISTNGSEEQKKKYLPKLTSGEWVGCMAMSEPHVGTDVLGMKTSCKAEKENYIINGRKMWITNGAIDENKTPADVAIVYVRNSDSKSDKKSFQFSTFIVSKNDPGYSVGQKIKDKLGMRASNTVELVFEDCKVPASALIDTEGKTISHMMKNLEIERLTLSAMSIGIAKRCLVIMNKYAQKRESMNKPLNQFGQIQKYIADSFAQYQAARAYTYNTAHQLDSNKKNMQLDSDGSKLFSSTAAKNIADNAIQVLGGYGYVGEYVVERLWRDSKLLEIGGGTLEAHQKNITKNLQKNIEIIL